MVQKNKGKSALHVGLLERDVEPVHIFAAHLHEMFHICINLMEQRKAKAARIYMESFVSETRPAVARVEGGPQSEAELTRIKERNPKNTQDFILMSTQSRCLQGMSERGERGKRYTINMEEWNSNRFKQIEYV